MIFRELKRFTLYSTGLDPALPFFATARQHWKLDITDADFVDVIHTNAGVYGKIETCGHVDFYMNGGQNQPICENDSSKFGCCGRGRSVGRPLFVVILAGLLKSFAAIADIC